VFHEVEEMYFSSMFFTIMFGGLCDIAKGMIFIGGKAV